MKLYSVSAARARLADLLDEAENGEQVVIERRGVRHLITVEEPAPKRTVHRRRIEILDDDVEAGNWTWSLGTAGLKYRARPARRP